MTNPNIDVDIDVMLPKAYILESPGTDNAYMNVKAGAGRTSNTLTLPLGTNMIRIVFPSYRGTFDIRGIKNGSNAILKAAAAVPSDGVVTIELPSQNSLDWFGIRAYTAAVVECGVTIYNVPPAT